MQVGIRVEKLSGTGAPGPRTKLAELEAAAWVRDKALLVRNPGSRCSDWTLSPGL